MTDGRKPKRTTASSKFTGDPNADTPAVEAADENPAAPAEVKVSAAFNQAAGAWDKDNNIFFILHSFAPAELKRLQEKAPQAIAEYRQMMGKGTSHAALTPDEIQELKGIHDQAVLDVKAHKGLTLEVAESLNLAAKAANVDHDAYLKQLLDTEGNLCGLDANHTTKSGPFKFDPQTWLYMVKTHGAEHGLDYFAGKIDMETGANGAQVLNVQDPTVLRQIMDLRNNPRLSAVMGAEMIKANDQLPPIAYKGVNYTVDPAVLKEQQAFLKLGFDIGPKAADGINGPLTMAAQKEFMHMYNLTDPAQLPAKLDDVLKQAEDLRARVQQRVDAYNGAHPKTTKGADGTETPVDPNSPSTKVTTAQAFGMLVASARSGVKVDHMANLAIAERAFEPGKPNRNRTPGLYQLTDKQWFMAIKQHGAEHGLSELADKIQLNKDGQPVIQDPLIRQYILNLRKDPRVAAMMEAEHCKEAPVWIDIASCYMNETTQGDSADINHFIRQHGFKGFNAENTYWCAAFLNSVLDAAGVKGNGSEAAHSFIEDYGDKVKPKDVMPGDIVVMPRNAEHTKFHVAMVVDKYQKNGVWYVSYLGGNQGTEGGGSVCVHELPLSSATGFTRPPQPDIMMANAPGANVRVASQPHQTAAS